MKLKHYLIASEENNYRPWIVTKTAMAVFVLSIWTLRLFMPGYIAVGAPGLDSTDLMARINTERTNRLLPALITNSKLNSAATLKSQDMIDRDYFAHVDPDGNYAWPLIEAQGYKPYKSLGENLAVDFDSAAAVVNAWMNSPGHRANILSEKYEDQGMAAVYGEFENHDTYTVTNLFGTLMKSATQPAPTPAPVPNPVPAQSPNPAPVQITPTPSPAPTPADEQTPQPTPTPSTLLQETITEPEQSVETNTSIPIQNANSPITTSTGANSSSDLMSLKIVIGIFTALYTFFLAIDSYIIHRAKVTRVNLSSSPQAVMMLMISIVNFFTIWI